MALRNERPPKQGSHVRRATIPGRRKVTEDSQSYATLGTNTTMRTQAPVKMLDRGLLPRRELHRVREPRACDDVSIEGAHPYLEVNNAR